MVQKFRKKPVVVEAEQFLPNKIGREFPKGVFTKYVPDPNDERVVYATFYVITIHGQETTVIDKDWIIPEPDGEHYYPCKPDIFEKTYELVLDES